MKINKGEDMRREDRRQKIEVRISRIAALLIVALLFAVSAFGMTAQYKGDDHFWYNTNYGFIDSGEVVCDDVYPDTSLFTILTDTGGAEVVVQTDTLTMTVGDTDSVVVDYMHATQADIYSDDEIYIYINTLDNLPYPTYPGAITSYHEDFLRTVRKLIFIAQAGAVVRIVQQKSEGSLR